MSYLDVAPVVACLKAELAQGVELDAIAARGNVPESTLWSYLTGRRKRVTPHTADKLAIMLRTHALVLWGSSWQEAVDEVYEGKRRC